MVDMKLKVGDYVKNISKVLDGINGVGKIGKIVSVNTNPMYPIQVEYIKEEFSDCHILKEEEVELLSREEVLPYLI